jgi:hypothetical protein
MKKMVEPQDNSEINDPHHNWKHGFKFCILHGDLGDMDNWGKCDDCGDEDILEYFDCCEVNLCSFCAESHDRKYPKVSKFRKK